MSQYRTMSSARINHLTLSGLNKALLKYTIGNLPVTGLNHMARLLKLLEA